ncbi:MAG: 50S ribosomal protein L11 methyltransferase [Microthrixaceae bacterium]
MSTVQRKPDPRFTVTVLVPASQAEMMADWLWSAGASAVVELDSIDVPVADVPVADVPVADVPVKLLGDLGSSSLSGLESAAALLSAQVISIAPVETDWALANEWRQFAQPWVCGNRVLLRPQWVSLDERLQSQVDSGDLLEVVLEPGSAFGSGSHVTTRLCVLQITELDLAAVKVLDVGCGTGVLSVVSALLGADSVLCIDSDPEAIRVTRLVAEMNGVSEKITALPAQNFAGVAHEFDLVLANLLLVLIEQLAVPLTQSLAPGGLLLLSGVLCEQQQRVEAALPGLLLTRVEQDEGWLSLLFQRRLSAASE